ncbi:BTAD domain-containing putative transcriptional regulator [Pelagicoccus mobilis]|uniref:Tetratricopeptide repeat protein n=1 Tax=Pelagicoccus mobilis TaxID=415221 RepID=A0A934VSM3_9BACT|nr:BTAD domain-containing putative transcriptional regulator [Pelagicoccus mobilis]MBK1879155.1 tetratricopeptide repeat protein [Pelagicoccus mobilis]
MSNSARPYLRIHLFADFELHLEGALCPAIEKQRQKSLLAYLAFNQGKPQSRSHLAFTFWPDSEEKQALTNLRNLLYGIRQALPEIDRFLEIDKQTISLRDDPECEVDRVRFETDLSAEKLESACKRYRGSLLPKFHDEWIEPERESLRLRADESFKKLIDQFREDGDISQAIHYSKIRIQHESLSESSQCTHIELLAESGDKAAALQAYLSYEKHLRAELEIEPGDEIRALRNRIATAAPPKIDHPPARESAPTALPTKTKARHLGTLPLLALSCAIALSLLFFFRDKSPSSSTTKNSIAVLPFDTRSQKEEDRFFADGFHDDLITQISRIQDFDIISRTSTIKYRNTEKDLKQIAKELGVTTIIEGGIQRQGNQIRINIQLIDANSGFHLWAENYTRKTTAENIFELQNEITAAITSELQGVLLPQSKDSRNEPPTQNLAALESYFYGRASGIHSTSEGLAKSIEHYKNALELDPNFAEAHTAIALSYLRQIHFSGKPVEAQVAIARSHVAKALQLDNGLSNAHVSLGYMKSYETDFVAAERAYEKAIELDPNNADAYLLYSISRHYRYGDLEMALELAKKSVELAPVDSQNRIELANVLMSLNRVSEAKKLLSELIKDDSKNSLAINRLGALYDYSLNRYDEAIRLYRLAYKLDPTNQDLSSSIAWAYLKLGDKGNYISWSERDIAVAPASHKVTFLKGYIHKIRGQTEESIASFAALKQSDIFFDWSVYEVTAAAVERGAFAEALNGFTVAYPWISATDVAINQKNCIQLIDYTYLLHLNGRQEQAEALGQRLIEFLPKATRLSQIGYQYFDSHVYLALGDKQGAYAVLQDYIDAGGCASYFATEVFTKSLHNEPEFQRLLAINNSRLAEQRRTLATWEANNELAPIPDLELSLGR